MEADMSDLTQGDASVDAGAPRSSPAADTEQRYLTTVARDNSRLHLGDVHYHGTVHQYPERDQLPKLHGVCLGKAPQIEPDAFKGRQEELKELRDKLSNVDPGNAQKVVSIVGMGGIGKTQLSLAYVRQYSHLYSSVFWLDAKDVNSLEQDFTALSSLVFSDVPPNQSNLNWIKGQIQKVREWLSLANNDRWLLIFDNYDDPNLPGCRSDTGYDIRSFFPFRSHGSILITTRSTKIAFSNQLQLFPLSDHSTSIAILSQRSGNDLSQDPGAAPLARRFGGLPLALATAGTYLATAGIDCQEYLRLYETMWTELVASEPESLFEYEERTLSSTWNLSLDRVRSQDEDAAKLLEFLAFFSPDKVSFDLIQAGDSKDLPWLARVTQNSIRFQRSISKLCSFSLVQSRRAGQYQIHPCLHDWLVERLGEHPSQDLFVAAFDCVGESMHKWGSSHISKIRLSTHVDMLNSSRFTQSWIEAKSDARVYAAAHLMGTMFEDGGELRNAQTMYHLALTGKEIGLGNYHLSTLNTASCLATVHQMRGNLSLAEALYLRTIDGYTRYLGAESSRTLRAIGGLSVVYQCLGNQGDAEAYAQRAIAGFTQIVQDQISAWPEDVRAFAQVLRYSLKRYQRDNKAHRQRLLGLIYCTMKWGFAYPPIQGLFAVLGKTLLDISEDTKNAQLAFWHSRWNWDDSWCGYVCDGCECRLTTSTRRYTCRDCPDIDFCRSCVDHRQSVPREQAARCNHSTFFRVVAPDAKDIEDARDSQAWMEKLVEEYQLLDEACDLYERLCRTSIES